MATPLTATQRDLVTSYIPLAKRVVIKHCQRHRSADRDECMSEAYFGLVQAARTYDRAMGVSFARHAALTIRWALLSMWRLHVARLKRETRCYHEVGSDRDTVVDPESDWLGWECVDRALQRLRPRERAIFLRLVQGETQTAIATAVKRSQSSVSATVRKSRDKLGARAAESRQ